MFSRLISCLMLNGVSLDNEMRNALVVAALSLARDNKKSIRIKANSCEGVVRKFRDFIPFMGQGGPGFYAEIETNRGMGKVSFLIPEWAIQEGIDFDEHEWIEFDPSKEARAQWN